MDKPSKYELSNLYYEKGLTQGQIGDKYGVTQSRVSEWMRECDISPGRGKPIELPVGKGEVERLYYDQGLSQTEIGEKFGVGQNIISARMREWGIAPGKRVDLAAKASRVPWVTYGTKKDGYEKWRFRDGDEMRTVLVHRLAAVAWYGLDYHSDDVVHHKNGIPWDNRKSNIEVLSDSAHKSHHANNLDRDEKGRFVYS